MHAFAYSCIQISLMLSLCLGGLAVYQSLSKRPGALVWLEKGQLALAGFTTLSSATLVRALVYRDFSFQYVSQYTDTFLPMFYSVTAFWAGQAGSLLFWAWASILCVALFAMGKSYARLDDRTRVLFWVFAMSVQAFFLFLLAGPSNPFIVLDPAPADGNGLNPLLRNPGMIFHPPLLFLGYAGFTVPACLALATRLAGRGGEWMSTARPWNLVSWAFLTAGIVLGAWWSYMELGWGGYWAWDPVENASLIPWLAATAFLHTAVIQKRRNGLHRVNVFLMAFTLILCFFATYLVRSGVIDSLHAFGTGGVGGPLLVFILGGLVVAFVATVRGPESDARPLGGLGSRQGVLVMACWLLLALAGVIFMGTMWPVISTIWSDNPVGLEAGFYNRVCLPLFALLAAFLVVCPWLGWKGGMRNVKWFAAVAGIWLAAMVGLWFYGVRLPLAMVAAASGIACVAGVVALFLSDRAVRRQRSVWAAYGVHLGLALMVVGVAFSGPYQLTREVILKKGEAMDMGGYTFTYADSSERSLPGMAVFEALVKVSRDGEAVGELRPQRRLFRNFSQPFSEVSVIPGLGDELYSTVLAFDREHTASFKLAVNPLVNWLWIGGTIMSLMPLVGLGRRKIKKA